MQWFEIQSHNSLLQLGVYSIYFIDTFLPPVPSKWIYCIERQNPSNKFESLIPIFLQRWCCKRESFNSDVSKAYTVEMNPFTTSLLQHAYNLHCYCKDFSNSNQTESHWLLFDLFTSSARIPPIFPKEGICIPYLSNSCCIALICSSIKMILYKEEKESKRRTKETH